MVFAAFLVVVVAVLVPISSASAVDEATTTTTLKPVTTTTSKATTTSTTVREATTTTTIRSETSTYLDRSTPGIYVNELAAFGESMVQVATGVPLIVGVGPEVAAAAVNVSSVGEFNEKVPSASSSLQSAVQQFFSNGGTTAFVAGATGTSAASITTAFASPVPAGVDLLISADLGALSSSDWLSVATTMGRVASKSLAIALVDPSQQAVLAATGPAPSIEQLTTLGTSLREATGEDAGSVFLFASGVTASSGDVLQSSSIFAGIIASTDAQDGFWNSPVGFWSPIANIRPQFAAPLAEASSLVISGLAPVTYYPGRGTVVMSDRLLIGGANGPITVKRTLDTIHRTVIAGLTSYVFDANDAVTWQAVVASTSGYLSGLFSNGALVGASAADSYTVLCGIGSTMTADDVLNGYMILSLSVAVENPGRYDIISITEQMGN